MRMRHDHLLQCLSDGIERGRNRVQVGRSPDARVDERGHLPGQQPGVVAGSGEWPGISGKQLGQPG